MTKNLEIIREAREKYEKDLETVYEMIKLLQGNKSLIGIKFQISCTPFKFKTEDADSEYTVVYRYDYWDEDTGMTFGINKEDKNPQNPEGKGRNTTMGIINISKGTFKSSHLKEFAKILKAYKDLMEEDFVTSAKEYLA